MKGGVAFYLVGAGVLLALAGCGRSFFSGERAPWRHQAEVECLKSGAVKIGASVVQIEPIEGPGMCGADFPLKVAALGESNPLIGYADDLRPPGSIPNNSAQMPRWPINEPQYVPPASVPAVQSAPMPVQSTSAPRMRWVPGPPPAERQNSIAPAGQPISLGAPGTAPGVTPSVAPLPNDIPDDAVLPPGRASGSYSLQRAYGAPANQLPQRAPVYRQPQRAYDAPVYQPPQRALPALGPGRGRQTVANITPATLTPPATLACPIVSALDHWVGEGVQPAAMRWFGTPVTEIKQISAYSCRGMVGAGGSGISEHAFGNAIDIAAFTFADGRRVTVQDGWHGSPEEQGFLRDVHLAACDNFTTVLAPGYNAAHYNHIHVDLMRRASGERPCRPEAMSGQVAAAKARALYAGRQRGPAYTGLLRKNAKMNQSPAAVPGEDGYLLDDVLIDLQNRRGPARDLPDHDVTGTIAPSASPRPIFKKTADDRLIAR
ncbi:MAG: extensin family protein [Pseudolabrys sp.]